MRSRQFHRLVDIEKSVDTARLVQFQIDIQNLSASALTAEPPRALGDADAKLDQRERLSRLGRPGQKHLMSLTKDPVD